MDGTFGHAWADFDAAVDPPGDLANNAVNVEPFVTRGANHAWRLRPDLGPGPGVEVSPEGGALVLHIEYRLLPGGERAFAAAARQLREAMRGRAYVVYELVSGGELPTYVLWIPVTSWADAGSVTDRSAAADRALASAGAWVRAELWRFRPDLSICRAAAAHCHRTLPSASGAPAPHQRGAGTVR